MNEARSLDAHIWDRHPEDWYVEPFWCSERLFAQEAFSGPVYDPACGLGRIVKAARDAGLGGIGTDLLERSIYCVHAIDFLLGEPVKNSCGSVVSNPPFKHAEAFIAKALQIAQYEVAMLLPSKFLFGDKRSRWLVSTPLYKVLAITPRPSMPPGPVIEAGIDPGGGREDFCWMIWRIGFIGTPTFGCLRRDP